MDLRAASPIYDRSLGNLEHFGKQFFETGFVVFEAPKVTAENWHADWREHREQFPIGQTTIRKVMRKVARDLKRPIILVEGSCWSGNDRLDVTLKQTKKTAPLIAQFLLLEEDATSRWGRPASGAPITRRQDKTNWYVSFHGKRGRRIFNNWMAHCTSDPACRAALKLPSLAPDLKAAA